MPKIDSYLDWELRFRKEAVSMNKPQNAKDLNDSKKQMNSLGIRTHQMKQKKLFWKWTGS